MKRASQLPLGLPVRGGKRRGAGRKPKGERALVSHKLRPRFEKPAPVHVTLRAREHVWNLRSRRSFRRIQSCFEKSRGRFGARSPTELVNAIRYVLDNAKHHFGAQGVDQFSSAALVPAERLTFLAAPLGWLLRVGWKRAKCEHDSRAGLVWTSPLEAEKIG